jgi:hypothetical protein
MKKHPFQAVSFKDIIVLYPLERALAEFKSVVIAKDQIFFPVKTPGHFFNIVPVPGEYEISQNINFVFRMDRVVPVGDQGLVMFVDVGEGPKRIVDNLAVSEMGISREINHFFISDHHFECEDRFRKPRYKKNTRKPLGRQWIFPALPGRR